MKTKARNQKLPALVKKQALKLAKGKKAIHGQEVDVQRNPKRGYPVIIRREVTKGVIQLTLSNKRWYIKEIDNKTCKVAPSVSYINDSVMTKGKGYEQWVGSMGVEEAARILAEASDRGTRVHAAITHAIIHGSIEFLGEYEFLEGRPFTGREFDLIHHWGNWWRTFRPLAAELEFPFFNEEEGYAGTIDFFGAIDEGLLLSFNSRKTGNGLERNGKSVPVVLDWKTGNDIRESDRMQIAAYMNAVNSEYGAIVRVGAKNKNGFEMNVMHRTREGHIGLYDEPDKNYLAAFNHCKALFNIFHGDELPDVVKFNSTFTL